MGYSIPQRLFLQIDHDPRAAIDRAGEQVARALEAVRLAVTLLEGASFSAFRPDPVGLEELAEIAAAPHVLTEAFRRQISRVLGDLKAAEPSCHEELQALRQIIDQLETARTLSQRVDDIIVAERVVAEKRQSAG